MDQTRTGGASGEEPAAKMVIGGGDAAVGSAAFGCFDCNICLECATDPVVTLCGHLYCWPCIYQWLCPATTDPEADDAMTMSSTRRQCPVCKAALSPDALVPLYGRGLGMKPPPPRGLPSSTIPPRRPALRRQGAQGIGGISGGHQRRNFVTDAAAARTPRQFDGAVLRTAFGDGGGGGVMQSTTAGGMAVAVLPWGLRGGQGPPPGLYYSGSYDLMNARQRRWHMEVERSLHQLWFFLFVFVALCLLLF